MTHDIPFFTDLIIIIAASLPIVFLARRLGLPALAGFVVTGMIIGPYGLGMIGKIENVESAAEVGVVLLLFTVGLEFSLSRLLAIPIKLYIIGALQVLGTSLAGYFIATALGLEFASALIAGFVLAVSSTAVTLKVLADSGELEAPVGRMVVTIALVQDIAVVPMLLTIGFLAPAQSSKSLTAEIIETVLVVSALVLVLYLLARYVLPHVFHRLMTVRTSEVVLLFSMLVLLGTAWLTSQAGLSLAIGAFAAGLILAETPYLPQIFAEVAPFRTLFSSLFFVSIGMLLDLRFVITHPIGVLFVALAVLIVKPLVILVASFPFRITPRVALQGGLYLAQIGEFAFLLISAASAAELLVENEFQYLIAASSLSLAMTPLVMQWAPRLTWKAQSKIRFLQPSGTSTSLEGPSSARPHPAILIVGYGLNGQNVSRVLKETGLHFEILEANPDICRRARDHGHIIHYGDATSTELLTHISIEEFETVVIAISDPGATRRAVSIIRDLHPSAHLIVRTRLVAEVEELQKLGASAVVPEEFETSLRIFAKLLAHYNIPPHIIAAQIDLARGHGYGILRSPGDRDKLENLQSLLLERLVEAVVITLRSPAIGREIASLGFTDDSDCRLISLLRDGKPVAPPLEHEILREGDLVVLFGNHEALHLSVRKLVEQSETL